VTEVSRATEPRADDYGHHAVLLDWERHFLPWLKGKYTYHHLLGGERLPLAPGWKPGQHMALIGPTGEGKSTFAVGLLGLRKWVVALDPKGEDETLKAAGYERITRIPPPDPAHNRVGKPKPGTDRWVWDQVQQGKPVGLVVGFEPQTDAEDVQLHELMRESITWTRRSRGWTLYVDEFELLSSQRMFRLGPDIERMLITARRAGTSVVTSFQAAAWVSKHATRQASFTCLWPTRDRQMIKNVAEAMGRDWRMIASAADELPPFHVLVIPKQIRRPMVVTTAPKIS
jgi:hypothetical protein